MRTCGGIRAWLHALAARSMQCLILGTHLAARRRSLAHCKAWLRHVQHARICDRGRARVDAHVELSSDNHDDQCSHEQGPGTPCNTVRFL